MTESGRAAASYQNVDHRWDARRVTGTQAGGVAELITRRCEAIFAIGLGIIRIAGGKGRGEDQTDYCERQKCEKQVQSRSGITVSPG